MNEIFYQLIENKVFISCFLILLISQSIKILIKIFQRKKINFKTLIETGGMPSSHSAIASGLFFSIYFQEGISILAVLSFFIGLLIIRDAFGLRKEVGLHAKVLNELKIKNKIKCDVEYNELSGHTFIQVIVGIILAFIVSFSVFFI
jgi:uncharacterized protein